MSNEELLGLMIGLGFLAAVAGYLADVWFHPDKYRWLALPRPERKVGGVHDFTPARQRRTQHDGLQRRSFG